MFKRLPVSGEDDVAEKPLVTDDKGKEYVPESRKKKFKVSEDSFKKAVAPKTEDEPKKGRSVAEKRQALYGKDKE